MANLQRSSDENIDEGNSSEISLENVGFSLERSRDSSSMEERSPSHIHTSDWKPGVNPAHINWSETYSSDEDSRGSQRNHRRLLQRSYSDPSLEESLPILDRTPPHGPNQEARRRSRSVSDEDSILCDDEVFEERRKSSCPKQSFSTTVRSILFCTPMKWLAVVFVMTLYTTFWLPYPAVRPRQTHIPKLQTAATKIVWSGVTNVPKRVVHGSPALLHARASPDLELTYKPGLDRYYKQEGFSNHAWTKYANIGVLGFVLVWAAWERRRYGESATGHDS